jgi:hypothetical protein
MLLLQALKKHIRYQIHAGPVFFHEVANQANTRFLEPDLGHRCYTLLNLGHCAVVIQWPERLKT